MITKGTVSVIITAYNQGSFLAEAIESVVRQIKMPDEILISDDASDDNTYEIAKFYQNKYPSLIKINKNEVNLGIVKHFNKAVSLTFYEYISILNADDRYRSDFLEKTSHILANSSNVGIVYSDFALFGSRAKIAYNSYSQNRRGLIKADKFFIINFPDFNEVSKEELLTKGNFIHGASLFRREAFDKVGGYLYHEAVPEDYSLFSRMVKTGWNAYRVPHPILEYRQYSKNQTNARLATFTELEIYKQIAKNLYQELQEIKGQLQVATIENEPNTKLKFSLTDINLLAFPDWQQSEELLYKDLYILIQNIITHPEKDRITLLIDNSGISEEDATFIISDVALNLLQQEDLDITEEPAIHLISNLTQREWQALLPKITTRISLNANNKLATLQATIEKIPVCFLEKIHDIQIGNVEFNYNLTREESEFSDKELSIINQYKQENYQEFILEELRNLRKQIAEIWLDSEETDLEKMYLSKTGEVHRELLNSAMHHELLNDMEKSFLAEKLAPYTKEVGREKPIQYLLVAMLYYRPHELFLSYDIEFIPHWLLNEYIKYLFNSHSYFQEIAEADKYYHYIQGWIDYLHKYTISENNSPLLDYFIEHFVITSNFIPVYFNEINLKDIYSKRAEIIEYLFKLKEYKLDYLFPERNADRKKIRLGILAASFLSSSETFASLPVYEYLSRDFEVILYSVNKTNHPLEQYCQICANHFRLLPQDLVQQVNVIRADDLDILFIVNNVTAVTNQICLLSTHRLARIQVTSGGSVTTTGMRHIDYYISGTLTDPSATAEQQYREKLLKLEGSAHCFSYGNLTKKQTTKIERKSLGISDDAVIFISGANYFKIIPELINTWTKIIREVPNSVLVLLPFGPNWSNAYPKKAFLNYVQLIFSRHGIEPERLIVLDPQPVPDRDDVREYFKIADVYLDSYPFSGTTSLIEPLEVGLPVIARQGNHFRSAMGAAMLQTLDVPGLVAHSEESYIDLAIALGKNSEWRQQASAEIKQKMQNNPSFLDSRSYSAKIGRLFQELFSNYVTDSLSENLLLRDINLIIFPDWNHSEEILYKEIGSVITSLVHNSERDKITLLIDISDFSEENANLFLSDIAMNLLMEENLDLTDDPQISLVGQLNSMQWQTLLPRIQGRIVLQNENKDAIAQVKAENLSIYNLDNLVGIL